MPVTDPSSGGARSSDDSSHLILIKYGGNAMTDAATRDRVIGKLAELHRLGHQLVLVHGGGPFISENLERAGLKARFEGGHRVTDAPAMEEVQQALRGRVNGDLVKICLQKGLPAVGISGKDGQLATARKRRHTQQGREIDLGFVGDVQIVQPRLLHTLLDAGYLPVVSPISIGEDGEDYNVNADMFAGELAGALQADYYLVLTDIDGLRKDLQDAQSHIARISLSELQQLPPSTIQGGMIPKIDGCRIALERGARACYILNGTKPDSLREAVNGTLAIGTRIEA